MHPSAVFALILLACVSIARVLFRVPVHVSGNSADMLHYHEDDHFAEVALSDWPEDCIEVVRKTIQNEVNEEGHSNLTLIKSGPGIIVKRSVDVDAENVDNVGGCRLVRKTN